jgi:hypothetical protein
MQQIFSETSSLLKTYFMINFNNLALEHFANMICGNKDNKFATHFPYRSSSQLSSFFRDCDMDYRHDGSTRFYWVLEVLKEVSTLGPASHPDLPSGSMLTVLTQLMHIDYYDKDGCDRHLAFRDLNILLDRSGLVAYEDNAHSCHIRNTGSGAVSALQANRTSPLTSVEMEQKKRIISFFDSASEDEFTEKVLVPFFQRQGFHRVEALGHKEKILEFGKDMWMKFQLPTSHWIYFCVQVKRVKIDAKGESKGNVSEVLNQAKMALDHPIFDPDFNKKVLLDHLYLISASDITRQARDWLIQKLDADSRRHIIFMDRNDFLNHAARIIHDINLAESESESGAIPF